MPYVGKIADEFIIGDITNYDDVINFGNKVKTEIKASIIAIPVKIPK